VDKMMTKKLIILLCIAVILIACVKRQHAEPKTYIDTRRGIQFQYPNDWKVENLVQQDVLLLLSPRIEENWQTNIFLELRIGLNKGQSVEQRLNMLTNNLKQNKKDFILQSSKVFTHASGLPAGELIYTHSSQGIFLKEKEIILWLTDSTVLFVTGSAILHLWNKYESQMTIVFDSVRPLTK
jgi:hypothetical protein